MSGLTENSLLQKVRYSNFKNDIDEQTTEILISPIAEENSSRKKRGRIDNLYMKLMGGFVTTIILIIISYILYSKILPIETHSGANNYEENSVIHTALQSSEKDNLTKPQESSSEMSNENNTMNVPLPEFGTGSHSLNTCVPLKSVKKVILVSERAPLNDYFCSDNATCHTLLQKIEQDQKGISYNFVIGTGGELYVGLGFTCLINSSESALYIKFTQPPSLLHGKECLRLNEVIYQGFSCGFISEDFTLLHKESDSEFVMNNGSLVYYKCLLNNEYEPYRSLHFHDPNHEINTLIHGDFKWTVCGNYSNTTELRKSRVITLESLPKSSCLPLNLVNEIFIDVIETQPFNCSDNLSCIQTFEEHHDGFKFNFIVGHERDVYVGLGFKCRAENSTGNVLKIKILELPGMSDSFIPFNFFSKARKFLQILEEGIACGKVAEHFSIKANCHRDFEGHLNICEPHYEKFRNKNDLDNELQYAFGIYYNEDYYNITSEHGRGIVPGKSRFSACNRGHLRTDLTTVTPDAYTDTPSTIANPFDDEYDYSYLN